MIQLADWFDVYRTEVMPAATLNEDIADVQKEELRRRKAEYLANPSVASDWDEASFDRFIKDLADARTTRNSGSQS